MSNSEVVWFLSYCHVIVSKSIRQLLSFPFLYLFLEHLLKQEKWMNYWKLKTINNKHQIYFRWIFIKLCPGSPCTNWSLTTSKLLEWRTPGVCLRFIWIISEEILIAIGYFIVSINESVYGNRKALICWDYALFVTYKKDYYPQIRYF